MTPLIENPFSWVYFPTALVLGSLHALEPGHAKTLTAAYLIGIKGTKRDALLLGLSVAFTHSLVVVGISVAALWLGKETFTKDVTHWLQVGSGVAVILLGVWMLVKRLRLMRSMRHSHHSAPDPIHVNGKLSQGTLEIVSTSEGERMRYVARDLNPGSSFRVVINRSAGSEVLDLQVTANNSVEFLSTTAPSEPHTFSAQLEASRHGEREIVLFEMREPDEHGHDHSHMTDDEHSRAHAATLPEYAKKGARPSLGQIIAFGAAGGMVPCPASITVMLLALSIGRFASGVFAVAGFSLGLAITLVGIGLLVVAGLSRIHGSSGRLHWLSSYSPALSAVVVIFSGLTALLFAH